MQETTTAPRRLRLHPVRPACWCFDTVLLAAFVALTVALASGYLLGLDIAVVDWADTHRPDWAYWTARIFNYLGQGTPLMVIAVLLGALLAWRTRSVRPLLPPAAAWLLIYGVVGPLKLTTDRAAPSATYKEPFLSQADAVELFHTAGVYGRSYPSGHVVNTIVWYGVLALLLAALLRHAGRPLPHPAVLALRVLPPAIVLVTTTYLGWHWFTDSVAGLLLGLLLDRLLHRIPWDDLPLPGRLRAWGRPALYRSL